MRANLLVIDDFYTNPDQVRNFALTQPFDIVGNYPGARTKPFLTEDLKNAIQYYMKFAGDITDWFEDSGYTGAFQLATAYDRTWIHTDSFNMWAGVCYLTPDAPLSSGTGFFKHKATGEFNRTTTDHESSDYTKWELVDRIGNRYNRLILFRADLFHASLDYFGDSPHNCRLFQTFFFNTSLII